MYVEQIYFKGNKINGDNLTHTTSSERAEMEGYIWF